MYNCGFVYFRYEPGSEVVVQVVEYQTNQLKHKAEGKRINLKKKQPY
jgi:hypothetical protein